ncbi:benzoate 1,2-dioxygenase electron transfer component BenC [Agilicoccus flavus]|uniref:benzoate 1,2-dioxygenase electron transfer component BenC n=1 Tax=Agilicoccus flavus TaxID=2775968 RepID=UPI001CF60696|nr:benzoate 1,2-dioxygenase electron transfer component BenC [Agilicoccus flavus]
MTHQVALSFEDGVTKFITCADGQTVADASYRARINIPLDCRDGACGTCKAFCESGEYDGGTYIEDALSGDEAEAGYCLPCSMKPSSDLVLQIASTSAVAKTQAQTFRGELTRLDRVSPTTFSLEVRTPDRDKLAFLPGQYVNIAVPGTDETRSYSFSNAPDDEALTFLIKVTPGGAMSTYLQERAAVGDEVTFTGPNGSFFLRESPRPLVLLAGGTGLAPILAILRRLVAEGSERSIRLVYGATTDDDVIELDTLAGLAEQLPNMTWDYCVADKNTTATNQGYVTALFTDEHLHAGDAAVYLCGPPPMVEAVRSHLASGDVEPAGFYYEKFALSGTAAGAAPPAEVTQAHEEPEATQPTPETVDTGSDTGTDTDRDTRDATPAPGTPAGAPADGDRATTPLPAIAAAELIVAREADRIGGQSVFGPIEVEPLGPSGGGGGASRVTADPADGLHVAGQLMGAPLGGDRADALDEPVGLTVHADAAAAAGQVFATGLDGLDPLVAPRPRPVPVAAPTGAAGVYEIGEEHPGIEKSDAIFDARQALELGAVELTVGRLSTSQLAGYRLLADATLPYVEGDAFTDAAAYTETNAAFHEYLFGLTGNEHLLQAYRALGVKGHMEQVLRNATWCHPRCATDHVEIVEAFAAGDRDVVRRLVSEHADRSKETMRRAMGDAAKRALPAFITPGRFDGLVVLVTGAAQGIGERTARRISAEGGTVVLADRSELVDTLAEELGSTARPAEAVVADLETWEGARAVVRRAVERFGRLDVAIHTVGGTIWAKPFHEYPADQISAEINRSLFPTLWGCRAAAEQMVGQGGGTIVNVSSVATRGVHRVPYAAAKGGVNAITASLALELAPYGIRVVATAPGGTDAPARRVPRGPAPESDTEKAWYQAIVDQTVESSLLKRYGTLDEQAAALCFLASAEASYITGTVLPVAGGDLG